MFDTSYVRITPTLTVGEIPTLQVDEVRKLIQNHPEYDVAVPCCGVAHISTGVDDRVISIEQLREECK